MVSSQTPPILKGKLDGDLKSSLGKVPPFTTFGEKFHLLRPTGTGVSEDKNSPRL